MINKEQKITEISNFVLAKVAKHSKFNLENMSGDTFLSEVGVDSLVAVMLCGYLEDEYELELEPIEMFKYKTADEVAKAILVQLQQ